MTKEQGKATFLYMTDPHIKGTNPSTRTDDFTDTIFRKVEDFFVVGEEMDVDFYMCGGDIVDSPYSSNRIVERLGGLFSRYLSDEKEMFFVWGNHDVFAWNPKTAIDTPLGLFQRFYSPLVLLTEEPTLREYNGVTVSMTGVSSYARLDKDILGDDGEMIRHRSEDYMLTKKSGDVDIRVIHGFLSTKELLEDIPHTVVDTMKETEANLTLTGHEHTGFPPVTIGENKVVCNPGALGRVFASHTEINRMPQLLHGTVYEDGRVEVKLLQSRIAREGDEVMDRSALDEKKVKERILEEAKGNIREVLASVEVESVSLDKVIQSFKDRVEERHYNEAVRRLEEQENKK